MREDHRLPCSRPAVVCNSMAHDINDAQRHGYALSLRWTEVEFMHCCRHRRSIPFLDIALNMLSLFSKAAPRVLKPLATTASRPSFPLIIQKATMSTCRSSSMTPLDFSAANKVSQPSVATTSLRPAPCSMSLILQQSSQEAGLA